MAGTSAMAMFAALLDRSVARIGELAADARHTDRQEIARIADIWDNNTFPLFETALSRPGWLRERRARSSLGWMAALSPDRRKWMIGQSVLIGHRLEPLLPPSAAPAVHYRDYQGRVQPNSAPLTPSLVTSMSDDYDLARAEVRTVRVERAGLDLSGHIALSTPRRYAAGNHDGDAVVQLFLSDVEAVRFDSDDAAGLALSADPAAVEVRFGLHGRLHGASAAVFFDDSAWHLSRAGRAAEATTPHRRAARRPERRATWSMMPAAALDAAQVLHHVMIAIRTVRYPHVVGRMPLQELVDAFTDAGTRILGAANERRAGRDCAFRKLTEEWVSAVPRLAHRIAERFPEDHWIRTVVPVDASRPVMVDLPDRAQLTLAAYTTAHTQYGRTRDASAVVNLAIPDGAGRWSSQAISIERPTRLSLDTAAFITPQALSYAPGGSLSLGDRTLRVTRHTEAEIEWPDTINDRH